MNVITDQKRVARGEHLRLATKCLRARDGVHNGKWKVLMIAGPEPEGEAVAIRELMPQAHILCVDKEMQYVVRAAEVADAILCCDLTPSAKYVESSYSDHKYRVLIPNPELWTRRPFDLIDLDFCGTPSRDVPSLIRVNSTLLSARGVLMVTFSYGRDVLEMSEEALAKLRTKAESGQIHWRIDNFLELKMPEPLKARIAFVLSPGLLQRLRSILAYRGKEMPMCALLIGGSASVNYKLNYLKLCDEDFEDVMLEQYGDPCRIYDCPAERLLFLRRSRSAKKAVATRQNPEKKQLVLFSINGQ